jgi:hypothetical protein
VAELHDASPCAVSLCRWARAESLGLLSKIVRPIGFDALHSFKQPPAGEQHRCCLDCFLAAEGIGSFLNDRLEASVQVLIMPAGLVYERFNEASKE